MGKPSEAVPATILSLFKQKSVNYHKFLKNTVKIKIDDEFILNEKMMINAFPFSFLF